MYNSLIQCTVSLASVQHGDATEYIRLDWPLLQAWLGAYPGTTVVTARALSALTSFSLGLDSEEVRRLRSPVQTMAHWPQRRARVEQDSSWDSRRTLIRQRPAAGRGCCASQHLPLRPAADLTKPISILPRHPEAYKSLFPPSPEPLRTSALITRAK